MPSAAPPPVVRPGEISQAVVRVLDAGHRVLLDRIDLAVHDARSLAAQAVSAAVLLSAGAICVAGAWFALLAGGVVFALHYVSLASALALAALLSLAVGAALIAGGLRRRARGAATAAAAPVGTP